MLGSISRPERRLQYIVFTTVNDTGVKVERSNVDCREIEGTRREREREEKKTKRDTYDSGV